jgi:hypothetical protein
MEVVKRISGPVSAHAFALRRPDGADHNLYVFGDMHFSYARECKGCEADDFCVSVKALVRDMARKASEAGTTLDVFLEMPYVSRDRAQRAPVIQHIEKLTRADKGGGGASDPQKESVVGVLGMLYHEFKVPLYGPKRPDSDSALRVHYADARHEPNVGALLMHFDVGAVRRAYARPGSFKAVLHALMFSGDFERDVRAVLPSVRLRKSTLSTVGAKPVHKIAKQFLNLPPGPIRDAIKAHLTDRADVLLAMARDNLDFPASAEAPPPKNHSNIVYGPMKHALSAARDQVLAMVLELDVPVLLMDAYTLCRSMRYAMYRPETKGGSTIIYAGDAHAAFYVDCVRDYMRVEPSVCTTISSYDQHKVSRCIEVKPCEKSRA